MIIEAKKSQARLSAILRTRKTCGVIQFKSKGLRTRGGEGEKGDLKIR